MLIRREFQNWELYCGLFQCPNYNKIYGCPNCVRKYKHKRDLTRHLNYECGQLPRFTCPFCDHKAKHKSSMRTHVFKKHSNVSKIVNEEMEMVVKVERMN
ncbi:hypothetical protein GE061_003391 [Apolygus lucorum]|uniref:C2H2-type domain-containing protein n=1 Tax=Apolygus lucorum TaxID=248454 RepID=A0A8S9X1E6_APOLU|nr:hypothetical protein GE061_003391 [Apolygus lucorum]